MGRVNWRQLPRREGPDFATYLARNAGHTYATHVFGLAGRRLMEAVVALFALLGFAFVPLGKKTALEHAHDIFTTPAALTAWRELTGATERLRWKVFEALMPTRPTGDPARVVETTPPPKSGPTPHVPALPQGKHDLRR